MKTCKYILFALSLCIGFSACQTDDDVITTNVIITANTTCEYTSARIECTVSATSASSVSYVELQYSTSASFKTYSSKGMGKSNGKYVLNLYNLASNTRYYVRFRVSNQYTSMYCDDNLISFQTKQPTAPTIGNISVSNITEQSAEVYCSVLNDCGSAVYERGFYLKPSSSGSWTHYMQCGEGIGDFAGILPLNADTEYNVCAYARNNNGEVTSNIATFRTLPIPSYTVAPTVVTNYASDIKFYSVVLGGQVTDDGGELVTEHGICYSDLESNPDLTNSSHVVMGGGTGTFEQEVTGLNAGTVYYARAYAQNNKGISYGDIITFTTRTAPELNTYSATNVTHNSAQVEGNVTSHGNTITERGICYSLAPSPTTDNYAVQSGSGAGGFGCTLSALQPATRYYARAYAICAYGTTYGNEISFTTANSTPAVETVSVTSVTSNSATVNAKVTSDGGYAILERGVCYTTSGTPTTENDRVINGVGIGSYSCQLSSLSSNTTYYVRAYVMTATGTVYGETRSFTTSN